MADVPLVAEGIAHGARALAVELVLGPAQEFRPERDRTLDHRIGIVDVEVDGEGGRPDRLRPPDLVLGELVRQHQRGAVEVETGVADAPARLREPELLPGAEGPLVELDGPRAVPDAQVGEELVDRHTRSPFEAMLPEPTRGVLNGIDPSVSGPRGSARGARRPERSAGSAP